MADHTHNSFSACRLQRVRVRLRYVKWGTVGSCFFKGDDQLGRVDGVSGADLCGIGVIVIEDFARTDF